jgi:hypothetical protein
MALTQVPVFVQTPMLGLVQFTASPGTYKTLYTGGANGSKIVGMWETNNDPTNTHLVTVQLVRSSILYGGMAITTAINDGFANGAPPKNLMSATNWPGLPIDSDNNPFLFLQSGDLVQATYLSALSASAVINIACVAADF